MQIGVDLNFAAQTTWLAPQLQFVPGLGPRKALALLKWVQRQDHVNARRPIYRGPDSSGCPLAKKVFWSVQRIMAYICTWIGTFIYICPSLSRALDYHVQQNLSAMTDIAYCVQPSLFANTDCMTHSQCNLRLCSGLTSSKHIHDIHCGALHSVLASFFWHYCIKLKRCARLDKLMT